MRVHWSLLRSLARVLKTSVEFLFGCDGQLKRSIGWAWELPEDSRLFRDANREPNSVSISCRAFTADHGVAEAVQSGWADAGVCVQLTSAEAGRIFLPVQQEAIEFRPFFSSLAAATSHLPEQLPHQRSGTPFGLPGRLGD